MKIGLELAQEKLDELYDNCRVVDCFGDRINKPKIVGGEFAWHPFSLILIHKNIEFSNFATIGDDKYIDSNDLIRRFNYYVDIFKDVFCLYDEYFKTLQTQFFMSMIDEPNDRFLKAVEIFNKHYEERKENEKM